MTPPGTEPHDVELTARDVERIRSADIVLYLGGGFQPAVEDAVDGASGPSSTSSRIRSTAILTSGSIRSVSPEPSSESPTRSAAQRVHPGTVADLRKLDRDFARGLSRCPRREIVTAHEAFGYLARRYRLEQVAITGISPEAEPTPRELERVIERATDGSDHGVLRDARLPTPR